MPLINVETHITGSAETQAAIVRQVSVAAVMRGSSANAPVRRPTPEPRPEPRKQGA
jgi:hypothetical protein